MAATSNTTLGFRDRRATGRRSTCRRLVDSINCFRGRCLVRLCQRPRPPYSPDEGIHIASTSKRPTVRCQSVPIKRPSSLRKQHVLDRDSLEAVYAGSPSCQHSSRLPAPVECSPMSGYRYCRPHAVHCIVSTLPTLRSGLFRSYFASTERSLASSADAEGAMTFNEGVHLLWRGSATSCWTDT